MLAAGFQMHVAKPVENAALIEAVGQVVSRPPALLQKTPALREDAGERAKNPTG